jgi:hypothetical protein
VELNIHRSFAEMIVARTVNYLRAFHREPARTYRLIELQICRASALKEGEAQLSNNGIEKLG